MSGDDDHPLLLELRGLRQTAARFQHEAHAAAIKLQQHSLSSSSLHEYATAVEQENSRLAHELKILRAHPDIPHHPAVAQVQELSLALRRVSDKIALTEDTLLERTSQLTDARSELVRARHAADDAYELAARMRAREEACKARERELEHEARASQEERKMVDLVVQEYADLVRNLEGRKSVSRIPSISNGSTSTVTLVNNLQDDKSTLHRILAAFSTQSEQLHATIAELNAKVSDLRMTLDAERVAASHDRKLLSQTKIELDKLSLEDQTAAKMVARYMKFSQASINALQQQITTLRTRHASTIATFEFQLSTAESQLASERERGLRLRDALDELCEDLARESYGRRREVALRLALLSREEAVAEFMRRWARRARELYARCYSSAQPSAPDVSSDDAVQEAFHRVVSDAESFLSTLDDNVQSSDATPTSGSLARITLAREAVDALRSELQDELQKRIEAIRKSAFSLPNGHLDGTTEDLSQPEGTPSQEGPVHLVLLPNGNARLEQQTPLSPSDYADSPVSLVGGTNESIDNPFIVPEIVATPIGEHTIVQAEIRSLSSPSIRDSASTSATLFVNEEPEVVQPHSQVVSKLDLGQDPQASPIEDPTTGVALIHGLPDDIFISSPPKADQNTRVLDENGTPIPSVLISTPMSTTEDSTPIPSASVSTPTPATSHVAPVSRSPPNPPLTLFTELGSTKHRYDTLQCAFRDCSLALKELKRTLASPSPSLHVQPRLRQHLEMALARIDDYAEDARVELEIRVADEELTACGFETVLSVPGALVDADERAEVEMSAREFVDGTDEGVATTLKKFEKKLEDVQHDVAVVKRAVHELAMPEEEDEVGHGEGVDSRKDAGTGVGWTAWTAGLLGTNATPSRSPTPVQTFGAVMTSPRLRHAASLKQLDRPGSTNESPDRGPLAGLNLRIPMPTPSHSTIHLGLGRAVEGPTRPRTLSSMYSVGGLRLSSVGLGVGLGGTPSPAPTRSRGVKGLGFVSAWGELHDSGGVE